MGRGGKKVEWMRSVWWCALVVCLGMGMAEGSGIAAEKLSPEEREAVRSLEKTRQDVIEKVSGTVVCIYGKDRAGGGSGVLFSSDGYALTNDHVVSAAGYEGLAGLADGELYPWKLIGTDPGGDLAIIQLQGKTEKRFPTAELGNSDQVRVGEWVMAMGNPFTLAEDQSPSISLGIVSGVKRYQAGQGMNRLVYGNCFQVDAAINPGNSGGPLFAMHGGIVGINGRCSFDERGRVNVGLGYAISSNQAKMFVPELLATKIATHGTLDAVFGTRVEGVICQSMNVDSAMAKLGLKLGDRIVALEGTPIYSANQLTSLLSTYPAGWAVRVDLETEEGMKVRFVRLAALPYEKFMSEEKEAKPNSKKIALDFSRAGKIRDAELNCEVADAIWKRVGAADAVSADEVLILRAKSDVDGMRVVIAIAGNGKFFVRCTMRAKRESWNVWCDGEKLFRSVGGNSEGEISFSKGLREPLVCQAMAFARMWNFKLPQGMGTAVLDGADQADRIPGGAGRVCARLSHEEGSGERQYVWLADVDVAASPPEMVKVGVGIEYDEPIASTLLRNWKTWDVEGARQVRLPQVWLQVKGLEERVTREMVLESVVKEPLSAMPQDVKIWEGKLEVERAK